MAVSDEVRPARQRPRTRTSDADRHGHPRRHRQPDPVAGRPDDPRGQPRPAEPRRDQGRRPPGVERLGRVDPDRALLLAGCVPATSWPSSRTPRPPTTPCNTCSATSTPRCSPGCASSAGSSRTRRGPRIPDPVDFSTGSVGLGAVAPMFAALADRYLRLHFRESIASQPERRFVALVGDAELDEGNVWEAILEEGLGELGNVTMIVDLNRQSLDRVVPGIRIRRVEGMFAAAGWHAIEAKYGRLLQERFASAGRRRPPRADRRHGERGLPDPHPPAGSRAARAAPRGRRRRPAATTSRATSATCPTTTCPGSSATSAATTRSSWSAPSARPTPNAPGRPSSSPTRSRAGGCRSPATASTTRPISCPTRSTSSGATSASTPTTCGRASPRTRPRARLAGRRRTELGYDTPRGPISPAQVPRIAMPDIRIAAATSTQQAFGDTLAALARDPEVGGRIVTAAPDVAVSTNLGGWINRAGVFATACRAPTATTSSDRSSGSRARPGATSSSASAR